MKLYLTEFPKEYEAGLAAFLALHGIENDEGGVPVSLAYTKEKVLGITKKDGAIALSLPSPHLLYRALTILKEHGAETEFTVCEPVYLKTLAAMFDGSRPLL